MGFKAPDVLDRDTFVKLRNINSGFKNEGWILIFVFLFITFATIGCIFFVYCCKIRQNRDFFENRRKWYQKLRFYSPSLFNSSKNRYFPYGTIRTPTNGYESLIRPDPDSGETSCSNLLNSNWSSNFLNSDSSFTPV